MGVMGGFLSQACPESSGPERLTTRLTALWIPITADVLAPCEIPHPMILDQRGSPPPMDAVRRLYIDSRMVIDALERLEPAPFDIVAAVLDAVVADVAGAEHVEA